MCTGNQTCLVPAFLLFQQHKKICFKNFTPPYAKQRNVIIFKIPRHRTHSLKDPNNALTSNIDWPLENNEINENWIATPNKKSSSKSYRIQFLTLLLLYNSSYKTSKDSYLVELCSTLWIALNIYSRYLLCEHGNIIWYDKRKHIT